MLKFDHLLSKIKWPKRWWHPLVENLCPDSPGEKLLTENRTAWYRTCSCSLSKHAPPACSPPKMGSFPQSLLGLSLGGSWWEVTVSTKIFPLNHTALGSSPSCFLIVTMTMSTLKSLVLNICETWPSLHLLELLPRLLWDALLHLVCIS